MADLKFLLQGLCETDDHFDAVRDVFSLTQIENGLIASAFMNASGASMIASNLASINDKVRVFVGIRNGVTTSQAIQYLVEHSIHPYLVDTASQNFIFHPKVYLACSSSSGRLVIGSANATPGGLIKNVEASMIAHLDLSNKHDQELVDSIYTAFDAMVTNYPENIFQVCDGADIANLVAEGLLEDEKVVIWKSTTKATGQTRSNNRKSMKLRTRKIPRSNRAAYEQQEETFTIEGTTISVATVRNSQLLWKSGKLTRRDLNIPQGTNTNVTGSMLLKKGDASQDIDPRSFFRETIFRDANWHFDTKPGKTHMERCTCPFRVIIKGVDFGIHELRLTHNSKTDSAAYRQHNSMTQIHWGTTVKSLIAKEDLLDCILSLYAPDSDKSVFTIVFDDE